MFFFIAFTITKIYISFVLQRILVCFITILMNNITVLRFKYALLFKSLEFGVDEILILKLHAHQGCRLKKNCDIARYYYNLK